MGEPLENIDSVIKAANIMVHDQGLHFSPCKVTVSTSGLVPQLKHFLHESNCALAVSLNATTDKVHFILLCLNLLEKHADVSDLLFHNKLCRSETGSCRLIESII
jgi:adenine C2-methylase RlmN of 23S rRNA A2503 and tRNA A37